MTYMCAQCLFFFFFLITATFSIQFLLKICFPSAHWAYGFTIHALWAKRHALQRIIRNGHHHHHRSNTHSPQTFCSPDLCPAYHHHHSNTHSPQTFCSPDLCPAYHHLSFDAEPKTCYNRYGIVLHLTTYHWLWSWLPAQLSLHGTIPYTDFQRAYLQLLCP